MLPVSIYAVTDCVCKLLLNCKDCAEWESVVWLKWSGMSLKGFLSFLGYLWGVLSFLSALVGSRRWARQEHACNIWWAMHLVVKDVVTLAGHLLTAGICSVLIHWITNVSGLCPVSQARTAPAPSFSCSSARCLLLCNVCATEGWHSKIPAFPVVMEANTA